MTSEFISWLVWSRNRIKCPWQLWGGATPLTRIYQMSLICPMLFLSLQVADCCIGCSIRFARYFCGVCNLFDDAEKGQYHCSKCGICRLAAIDQLEGFCERMGRNSCWSLNSFEFRRVGGKDNFVHCDTCGLCLQVALKESHKCVQQASHSNCPVCMEVSLNF